MTNRAWTTLLCLVGAASIAGMAGSLSRSARAESQAWNEVAGFASLRKTAEEFVSLRQATLTRGDDPKPARLATTIGEVLAAAGLPASTLANLSPESELQERTDQQVRLLRKRATLTLTPLTLPQFGRYLDEWRRRLPDWTVARIDLEPRKDVAPSPGSDLSLRVVITIENLQLAPKQGVP